MPKLQTLNPEASRSSKLREFSVEKLRVLDVGAVDRKGVPGLRRKGASVPLEGL